MRNQTNGHTIGKHAGNQLIYLNEVILNAHPIPHIQMCLQICRSCIYIYTMIFEDLMYFLNGKYVLNNDNTQY